MAEILIKHCALKMVQMFTLINRNITSLTIVCPELGISKAGQETCVFVHTCSIYKGHSHVPFIGKLQSYLAFILLAG